MVPTFTWGFFRSNTPFAMMSSPQECRVPNAECRIKLTTRTEADSAFASRHSAFHKKLAVGVEPTTSSLPRTRSTTELCQRSLTSFCGSLTYHIHFSDTDPLYLTGVTESPALLVR